MKIKLLVAAAATVIASTAMAQSAFQGAYGQLGTGYENNSFGSTNLIVGPGGSSSASNSTTASGAPLVAGLGYTFSVAPKFTLGIGADYSALSYQSGNSTFNFGSGCNDPDGGCANIKYKASSRVSVYLTPGYVIDKDKLAYLKAGYSGQSVQAQLEGLGSQTKNISGLVIGLGYKQMISSGFYGFAEGNYYSYSKPNFTGSVTNSDGSTQSTSINPSVSAYQFLVGVGYKF